MEVIDSFLSEREQKNLLRRLKPAQSRGDGKICFEGNSYFDFSSNDYLNISTHKKMKKAAKDAIDAFPVSASASRLLSGDLDLFHILEDRVARFKGKEKALVFNSGYQANCGIMGSLCERGDIVICDRLSHASILDGIQLSGAKLFRYRHNDIGHLGGFLKRERSNYKECFIVTETVFSMDGDKPPLREIAALRLKYGCRIIVDEAHATGIFGANGSGVVEEEGITDEIDVIMGTFSKALGSFGAYVASSRKTIDYLVNRARSFIYSTALPPSVIAADLTALDIIKEEPYRRRSLLDNSDFFRKRLAERGFDVRGASQIVPLILGDPSRAMVVSDILKERGFWVLPVRPPTVPQGESRLRFSLNYSHGKETIEDLIDEICEIVGRSESRL